MDILKHIHMVETFRMTLVDKSDGTHLTFDRVVVILHSAGYSPALIATYGDEARKKAQNELDSYRTAHLNTNSV